MKILINQTLNDYFPKSVTKKNNVNPKIEKELQDLNLYLSLVKKQREVNDRKQT